MPLLDVSFVLSDPMISDLFTVKRRTETVGANGRTTTTESTFVDQRGVVNAADPADLVRRDDGQLVPRVIEVNAPFAFREAVTGFQPDRIVYRGSEYLVKQVFPFSQYGAGHHRCLAESTTAMDPPR